MNRENDFVVFTYSLSFVFLQFFPFDVLVAGLPHWMMEWCCKELVV